jgi:hypothetical protein
MKLDTDGYDLFVLMGAKGLLERAQPPILGEFSAHCLNWHGQTVADVRDFVDTFDYRVFVRKHPSWDFLPL